MNTFLFAWNARKWPWPEIDEAIAALRLSVFDYAQSDKHNVTVYIVILSVVEG